MGTNKTMFIKAAIFMVLLVLLVISFMNGRLGKSKQGTTSITSELALAEGDSAAVVAEKKAVIVKRVMDKSQPLIADEKKALMSMLIGSKVFGYHFSREEQEAIVQAINRP